jgi:hypothetical protein
VYHVGFTILIYYDARSTKHCLLSPLHVALDFHKSGVFGQFCSPNAVFKPHYSPYTNVHGRSLLLAAYSSNVYTDSHQLVSRRGEVQKGERENE